MSDDEKIKLYKETYNSLLESTFSYKGYSRILKKMIAMLITVIFMGCFMLYKNNTLFFCSAGIFLLISIYWYFNYKNLDLTFESHNDDFIDKLNNFAKKVSSKDKNKQKSKAIYDLINYILFGTDINFVVFIKYVATVVTLLGFIYTVGIVANDNSKEQDLKDTNQTELNSVESKTTESKTTESKTTESEDSTEQKINYIIIVVYIVIISLPIALLKNMVDILGETKNEVLRNIDKYIANLEEEERIQNRKKQKLIIERKTITSDNRIINSKMIISYKNTEDDEKIHSQKSK